LELKVDLETTRQVDEAVRSSNPGGRERGHVVGGMQWVLAKAS